MAYGIALAFLALRTVASMPCGVAEQGSCSAKDQMLLQVRQERSVVAQTQESLLGVDTMPTPASTGGSCRRAWAKCGGREWSGPTCCVEGYTCTYSSAHYSQCRPISSPTPIPTIPAPTPTTPTPAPVTPSPTPATSAPISAGSSDWTTGTWTTGYWDCCKPSCSWSGKGSVTKPTLSCDAGTGELLFDPDVKSVCNGGSAASCANNQPFIVNSGLSMGFAAAAVGGPHGLTGDDNCGQCYELRFVDKKHPNGNWGGSHPDLIGKTMIVQVTNIGYDVSGEHSFDVQIPGAGQGAFDKGCEAQFSGKVVGDFDCDNRYGGCSQKSGCSRLPETLQAGCEWRYDWYQWLLTDGQTNNPYVDFRRVKCPSKLTDISGSAPLDDSDYPSVNVAGYA